MELTYIGHSCFKMKSKDSSIIIDPYDPKFTGLKLPKLDANILIITHEHLDHNYREGVSNFTHIIEAPGEYEISGIFINGISTFHDDKKGVERGKNTIYCIELEDMTVLHLGDLGHELSEQTIEKLPIVDILLIPVGGGFTIDAKTASKVISSLEPKIVIPMHYKSNQNPDISDSLAPLEKFLDEMGGDKDATKVDKLKVSKRDLEEETKVIVLLPQN